MRVAVVATHPVQYYTPWFKALAQHVDLKVLYCHKPTPTEQGVGFGVPFEWDIPLLDGYKHRFLPNRARRPNLGGFNGVNTPGVRCEIQQGSYDAVILLGWGTRSYLQALQAARRAGIPSLVRSDSQLNSHQSLLVRVTKYLPYRVLMKQFSGFLVVGQRSRAYLTHFGADPERMFFAPHCVDNDVFGARADALRPQKGELRARWNIPGYASVFLFVGKIEPQKRPFDFVNALAEARSEGCVAHGLIVGDGPLRKQLQEAVSKNNLPVLFTGFLNQKIISEAYAVADALVLPSRAETWGLVVNEAMASGIPAIVSDAVGCSPDLIIPGQTGEIFPMGSTSSLAAIIQRWSQDPKYMEALGRRARTHICEYSIERSVAGTISALEAVCRRSSTVHPPDKEAPCPSSF